MKIKFESYQEECTFLNPMKNFEPDTQLIEYRKDPLTKETAYLNITALESGTKWSIGMDQKQVEEIIETSREGCFMCDKMVETATPMYLKNILPDGRLKLGRTILFPNMFGLAKYSAVITYPDTHFYSLKEYSPDILAETITCATTFMKRVFEKDPRAKHTALGCNYLFPAGSSTVHSHFHLFMSEHPFDGTNKIAMAGKDYLQKYSSNYWSDLIEAEKKEGKRYLGAIGNTCWLVSFAPTGSKDVLGLVEGKSDFIEFDQDDIQNISEGLYKILTYYDEQNISSFNICLYSGPLGEQQSYLWPGIRVVARGYLPPFYTSDITWRQKLLKRNEEWFDLPETAAAQLKEHFNKNR